MELDFLEDEQELLARQIIIPKGFQTFKPTDILFGIDIQYVKETAFCAVSVNHFNGHHIQTFLVKTKTGMPYVSGFFCFREGPPVLRTIRKILNTQNVIPKLIIIDGHGIAHPRKLGVASWVGLKTNIPSMGIAKRPLLQYKGEPDLERGATLPIFFQKKQVGAMLRTRTNTKPVFVSPGFKISIDQATKIALEHSPSYRIANPIRLADQAARTYAKGKKMAQVIVL
ncbi:MAG: endonuclease V [Saprospiraceae bacterium]|nr:endonuclease V [Saprospiraceae bacterium]